MCKTKKHEENPHGFFFFSLQVGPNLKGGSLK